MSVAPKLSTSFELAPFYSGLKISTEEVVIAQDIYSKLSSSDRIKLASRAPFEFPIEKLALPVLAHYRESSSCQLAVELQAIVSPIEQIRSYFISSLTEVTVEWAPLLIGWYVSETSTSIKVGILNLLFSIETTKDLQRFFWNESKQKSTEFLDGLLRWALASCLRGAANLPRFEAHVLRLMDFPPEVFNTPENRRAVRILMAHSAYFRMRAQGLLKNQFPHVAEMPNPYDYHWYLPALKTWSPDRLVCAQFVKGPFEYAIGSPVIGRLAINTILVDHAGGPLVWSQDSRHLMATQKQVSGEHQVIVIDVQTNKISKLEITTKQAFPLQYADGSFWLLKASASGEIHPNTDLIRVNI